MSGSFNIDRIADLAAEDVWRGSPQSSVFSRPSVLANLHGKVEWWIVSKGREVQCAWPVPIDEQGRVATVPFSYWIGPLWSEISANHPAHRTLSLTTSVYELFIATFIQQYGAIRAGLHPTLTDVRVFDWWNYHHPSLPRFCIRPRYSAAIDFGHVQESLEAGFRELRRRELRRFERNKEEFERSSSVSANEVGSLYSQTVAIDAVESVAFERSTMRLLELVDRGHGWVQALRCRRDGSLACIILVLSDFRQANMVLNLTDRRFRSQGIMAEVVLRAMQEARRRGLGRFDFNGANSPTRGDDKHSYGSRPVLFFDISYSVR